MTNQAVEQSQTITISSKRYYMDELQKEDVSSLMNTFVRFNQISERLYNEVYDSRYCGASKTSVTKRASELYYSLYHENLSAYYQASLFSYVSGKLSSQRELFKLQLKERELRESRMEQKIDELQEDISKLEEQKKWCIQMTKNPVAGTYGHITFDGELVRSGFGKHKKEQTLYLYECDIDKKLKQKRTAVKLIKERLRVSIESTPDKPSRITFGGGKRAYRLKDTTDINMKVWHRERDYNRTKTVLLGGRHTSVVGNFICRYDTTNNTLSVTLIDGRVLVLENIVFPYRGDELVEYINNRKGSVGYFLERRYDGHGREYLVVKAVFTEHKEHFNYYLGDGVISYDVNYGHLDWTNVSADGNSLENGTIWFDTTGSSGKRKNAIRKATKELVLIAKDKKKPLGGEDLDFSRKKNLMRYESKSHNRILSAFAYSEIMNSIERRAFREDVLVIHTDPAYTSLIGKVKYSKQLNAPVHIAASYVIGRRILGFDERLPKYVRDILHKKKPVKHLDKWKVVKKHFDKIPLQRCRATIPYFKKWKDFDKTLITT